MSSILDKIVTHKLAEIAALNGSVELAELRDAAANAAPPLDFLGALKNSSDVSLIAEVKKASPSKGLIRPDFNPVEIASIYAANGASCVSVLTDENFFQGHLDYLQNIRTAVDIPLLRKDFILAPIQVYQARAAGADAVLLIAECLDDEMLCSLHDLIVELGMTPLVELYDPKNIDRVLRCGAALIGINNRDLNTFEVDLHHTTRLKQQLPDDKTVVGESGIFTNADVQLLANAGVEAMLVGESLMRATDIGSAVKRLLQGE